MTGELNSELPVSLVEDRTMRITLSRPRKRNALTPVAIEILVQMIETADRREDVHAVIIDGLGPDFCSGYDLTSIAAGGEQGRRGPIEDYERLRSRNAWWTRMSEVGVPIIAQVHGHCLAGGLDLALSCDLVVAAEDSKIGFPATRTLGIPAMTWIPAFVGIQRARELLMTGAIITGVRAAEIGLITRACPAADLAAVCTELAKDLADVPRSLMRMNKRSIQSYIDTVGYRSAAAQGLPLDVLAHMALGSGPGVGAA
jgi:enoyl-CoA hydratase